VTDLGTVLVKAESVVDGLLATSGCTISLRRPRDPAGDHVDPATLAVTDTTTTAYATGLAAIVGVDASTSDRLPARPVSVSGVRVVLRDEDAAQVQDRDEVVVETSRDPALVGAEYAVTQVQRSPVGVVAVLRCSPVRRP
jgi:hypothetical protein